MGRFTVALDCVTILYVQYVADGFSLVVSPGGSLLSHGGQHLADVRSKEVVHFVALKGEGQRSHYVVLFIGLLSC